MFSDQEKSDWLRKYSNKCLDLKHFDNLKLYYSGKTADIYDLGQSLSIVRTDRFSAKGRVITNIPFKGQLMTATSSWWFNQLPHYFKHHYRQQINPHTIIVQKCRPIPLEIVVRGYITGTNPTSLWTLYKQNHRVIDGFILSSSLRKNEKLERPVVTPTTKAEIDIPIDFQGIIEQNILTEMQCLKLRKMALALYEFGATVAESRGMILADTKYEFGLDEKNDIVLIDELHNLDCSRYWLKEDYEKRFKKAEEPTSLGRMLYTNWMDNKKNSDAKIPNSLKIDLTKSYITMLELLQQKPVDLNTLKMCSPKSIEQSILDYWKN